MVVTLREVDKSSVSVDALSNTDVTNGTLLISGFAKSLYSETPVIAIEDASSRLSL